MVFSSFDFLIKFLPAFLACYYICFKFAPKLRNACIFVFSIVFYAYGAFESGTPWYLALIMASVVFNYLIGRNINKIKLIIGIIVDMGILFVFKYSDFMLGTNLGLMLPIGISFYTFQIVSYLIDSYKDPSLRENSLIVLGAYIMMFPQLIAGPIVRYSEVRDALKERHETLEQFIDGLKVFILGLGSKVVIANQVGVVWQDVHQFGYDGITTQLAWLGIIAYSLQIYFDFYGYSLMAIGLGRMIGFEFPKNFDAPYTSLSMTEFWRRWHMTLGTWFREYVYIPLGGNRKGPARTYINMFIVWMLTGIWHGAAVNFVLWGFLLFAVMAVEKAGLLKFLERYKVFGRIYMLLLIPLQWTVFAVEGLENIRDFLLCLLGRTSEYAWPEDWLQYMNSTVWIMLLALILSTNLPQKLYSRYKNNAKMYLVLVIILGASVYCLYKGMNDPFLYFRF